MAITVTKTPEEGYKYIPVEQKKEKNPFAVWIKPIPNKDLFDLEDKMVQRIGEEVYIAQGVYSFLVVRYGLVNWEGITDSKGKALPITFEDGMASEESVANIPADLILEIANVIASISRDSANIEIFFGENKK
jgi:hypothetical protein